MARSPSRGRVARRSRLLDRWSVSRPAHGRLRRDPTSACACRTALAAARVKSPVANRSSGRRQTSSRAPIPERAGGLLETMDVGAGQSVAGVELEQPVRAGRRCRAPSHHAPVYRSPPYHARGFISSKARHIDDLDAAVVARQLLLHVLGEPLRARRDRWAPSAPSVAHTTNTPVGPATTNGTRCASTSTYCSMSHASFGSAAQLGVDARLGGAKPPRVLDRVRERLDASRARAAASRPRRRAPPSAARGRRRLRCSWSVLQAPVRWVSQRPSARTRSAQDARARRRPRTRA